MSLILKATDKKNATAVRRDVEQHPSALSGDRRGWHSGHKGYVVWLTGLPGSGKSTIAHAVEVNLLRSGFHTVVLDGDNIRHDLCADLGFSIADRNENVRRVGKVAKLFLDRGTLVFVAFISPMRSAREKIKASLPDGDFIEIYCKCPLDVCRQRDPKGLYAKADSGMIAEFTGVSSPYEEPRDPALILNTDYESVEESTNRLAQFLRDRLGVV